MHVVIIAWLFTIGVMALALSSALAGIAWFVGAGLLPVLLLAWLAARRGRRTTGPSARTRDGSPR